MDSAGLVSTEARAGYATADEPRMDPPPAIGTDERRMHVRAYNHWVSLLDGRTLPDIARLDPASSQDFGPKSVLLHFGDDPGNPAIEWLGAALASEGGVGGDTRSMADVERGSLLSRLTDHHLQIIANRAPIGFEAEFVNARGNTTLYRGILMPFSSNGIEIDYLYGVLNWKEVAPPELVAEIHAAAALAAAPAAPIWADGPGRHAIADEVPPPGVSIELAPDAPGEGSDELYDVLSLARIGADAVLTSEARGRAALYRALGLAYDFALVAERQPEDYAELLADNGLVAQARAPMTPVVKLVFGADYDKTRLTEFAAALAYGRRMEVPAGGLRAVLEEQPGGLKGLVAAERAHRRPPHRRDRTDTVRAALRQAPSRGEIAIDTGPAEFVLLVARRDAAGSLAIVAPVPEDAPLMDRALRRLAR